MLDNSRKIPNGDNMQATVAKHKLVIYKLTSLLFQRGLLYTSMHQLTNRIPKFALFDENMLSQGPDSCLTWTNSASDSAGVGTSIATALADALTTKNVSWKLSLDAQKTDINFVNVAHYVDSSRGEKAWDPYNSTTTETCPWAELIMCQKWRCTVLNGYIWFFCIYLNET